MEIQKKINITVIIPVLNEAKNLRRCLERLSSFEQVIVVDSNSKDGTQEIAVSMGVELYQFHWNGKYPKKRSWALQTLPIRNEWVLLIDADELLTESFVEEVSRKINSSVNQGYWLNYQTYFMNKKLRFGDKLKKLALFKYSKGAFEVIEEESWSKLDMEVHENFNVEGQTGTIRSKIIHKDFISLNQYIAKHNQYSEWESNYFINMKKKPLKNWTTRQHLKYFFLNLGCLPQVFFMGSYILKLGFLDGAAGYYFAKYKAFYFFQIQTKIIERKMISKSNKI